MAKVILITSREIVETPNTALNLQNIEFDEMGLAGKCSYCELFVSNPFPQLLKFDNERQNNLIKSARENSSVSVEKLIEMIKKEVTSNIKNKGGSNFVFGIFRKDLSSEEDTKVYFANEFPDFGERASSEEKYRYLNNILEELCALEKIECEKVDWEIISHDLDWGNEGFSNCFLNDPNANEGTKSFFIQIKDGIKAFPTLEKIVNRDTTRIQLFQHDAKLDDGYLYVERMMTEPNYCEGCTSFLSKTIGNIELFNKYRESQDDREAKLEEFISKVDPNYGFFPTKL